MKASETVFQKLLDGKIQYVVPLYQRTYSWEKSQWDQLWDDLLDLYAMGTPRNHFIGSVVTQQLPATPVSVSRYLLIDGQQRMTTLFVLLSEICRHAKANQADWGSLADEIRDTCLTNVYTDSEEEKYKLRPTQRDQRAFVEVVEGSIASEKTMIEQARDHFDGLLKRGDSNKDPFDLRKLHRCIVNHLDMVNITLESDDSPNRIFESLNNTGMPLSVADLIRNYLLMNISDVSQQDQAYREHWLPMEEVFAQGPRNVAGEFFWHYLMRDGDMPRKGDTYQEIQEILRPPSSAKCVEAMENFATFSRYYATLSGFSEAGIDGSLSEQIDRINQWEVAVAYPFLMKAMDNLASGKITLSILIEVMRLIESFVIRRTVCGIPTNMLRHVFGRLSAQVDTNDMVNSSRKFLLNNNWPDDDEFRSRLLGFPIYSNQAQNRRRANLVLWSLERDFGHKETPERTGDVWIEHIMPQELTSEWEVELGSQAQEVHQRLLHTIGNLTLTAYNRELSNKPFDEKKEILAKSHFALNESLTTYGTWDADSIGSRANDLANRALRIWKR